MKKPAKTRQTRKGGKAEARSALELAAALNRASAAGDPPAPEAAAPELAAPRVPAAPLRERVAARSGMAELLLFRAGGELFAADLAGVDEAVEAPVVRALPEMPPAMLGVIRVRGRMTPVYSPARALGVPDRASAVALIVRAPLRRVALAVDDVDDVLRADLSTLVEAPAGVDDIVLGMTRRGPDFVAIIDVAALVDACLAAQPLETR